MLDVVETEGIEYRRVALVELQGGKPLYRGQLRLHSKHVSILIVDGAYPDKGLLVLGVDGNSFFEES